jgi:hypothetical protein
MGTLGKALLGPSPRRAAPGEGEAALYEGQCVLVAEIFSSHILELSSREANLSSSEVDFIRVSRCERRSFSGQHSLTQSQ